MIDLTITYLAMDAPPSAPLPPQPANTLVMRAEQPTLSFYRYLYNTVGGPWLWYTRRLMNDADLAAEVQVPEVEVWVLYVQGTPAGYAELDRRWPTHIELAYFGLVPEYIGRGLGGWFLQWAVRRAWSYGPARLQVNTCTLDHERALATYEKVGFAPYHTQRTTITDPRTLAVFADEAAVRERSV